MGHLCPSKTQVGMKSHKFHIFPGNIVKRDYSGLGPTQTLLGARHAFLSHVRREGTRDKH